MLWVAVCDDEIMECCNIAGKIKQILNGMKIPCMVRQFWSGRELIQSADTFDIIFLERTKAVIIYVGQYFGIFPFLEFLQIYAECTLEVR